MPQEILEKYIKQFSGLKRGYNKGLGRAPHKPILLISMVELIQKGEILYNKIHITSELLLSFKNNWKKLVASNHNENFALPFFHLRSEPFWRLVTKTGKELELTKSKSIKSFKSLNQTIAYAEINRDLFQLLCIPLNNSIILDFLLSTYFPNTKSNYYSETENKIEMEIENQILNEGKTEYQRIISSLKAKMDEDKFEEEIFVRGGLFKKSIPKIYNNTCCISGMNIENGLNYQMIDACHIIPFSVSSDDTIPNGISLTPTLHRAFDRGLITINDNYIVRISPIIKENKNSPYSITQFEGKQIMVPSKTSHYPSLEALSWHRKEIFKL